jgi:phosphatidylserine decarboxylase
MSVSDHSSTKIWNRAERRIEMERVYGDYWLRLFYGSGPGRLAVDLVLAARWLSRLFGRLQYTRSSARRIEPFIAQFGIPMDEFESKKWASFNDFFIRRFRPGAREFCPQPDRMPAFSEARYLAFERVDVGQTFPVKGRYLTPGAILDDRDLQKVFAGGPMLLARLAPVDYHRFHFPDDGEVMAERRIAGRLHSVNPFALRHRANILATNERHVTILRTHNFGTLAYVEVGAMNVGRIEQTYAVGRPFKRGGEKGYFCFGASTILVFGELGRWVPSKDLVDQTRGRLETLVRLGEEVARAV